MNTRVISKKQCAIHATLLLTLILTLVFTSSRLQADTGTCGGANITLPFIDVQGNGFFCAIGSAILFDKVQGSLASPDFSGAFFPLPNAIPIPTLFGFNDKASRALVLGLCTLHDKTFFRGAAAFMFGGPTGVRFFLSDLGFNNRAASGISI